MGEKSVYKSLFKKLSALRATLTDEEQTLLDRMVTGEHRDPTQEMNQNTTITNALSATMSVSKDKYPFHQMNMEEIGDVVIRASYDPLKEIYHVD